VKVGKNKHEEFLKRKGEYHERLSEIKDRISLAAEDTVQIAVLNTQLEQEWSSINTLIEENQQFEPELTSLVSVNSLSLADVQSLLDENTTLVEYYMTEEVLLTWLITNNNSEVFHLDIRADSLRQIVEGFRNAIIYVGNEHILANELYDLLIAPFEDCITTNKLVIVPHGVLHYLPFQALLDNQRRYLIDRYQISYIPSASVLKYLAPKKRSKGRKFLAFGNPRSDKKGIESLPVADTEVNNIARFYKEHRVLTSSDASESEFKRLAPQYDVLHMACHAELNGAYPLFSGLLLAPDSLDDGELDVHEIFALELEAYLVVLSACQTSLGQLTNGDELVGLSRAFLYAGTPSIISSLWMVEDESTAFLMEHFYKYLSNNSKAESLRKAQLETRKKYHDCYSWASFVLIGDSE